MHRAARRLLTLLLGTALAAGSLTLVASPVQAASPAPGFVVAWGSTAHGQTDVPTSLAGKNVTAVAAGYAHSLALTDDGTVNGWGDNSEQQAAVPAWLAGRRVTAIGAGGFHSLALTDDGTVSAWGDDHFGQTPVPASLTGKRVTAIDAGIYHSLVLTDDGTVTAWGDDSFGQSTVPASLTGKRVTAVDAGGFHSLALTDDGTVTAWGDGSFEQSTVPASLTGKRVTAIAGGEYHSLALTDDGTVTAWGMDDFGLTTVPASLTGKRVTAIAAGTFHSLALTDDGTVTAWGSTNAGQSTVPNSLTGKRVTAIAASGDHSLALVMTPTVTTGLVDDTTTIAAGESVGLTIGASGADFQSAVVRRGDNAPGTITGAGDRWTITDLTVPGTYDYVVEAMTSAGLLTKTVTVVVTPAAAAVLHVSAPATALHGGTVGVTASGTDRFGNPTGDETGHVIVTSSDPLDSVSGTGVTFGSAGTRTLTVTHAPTGVTATREVTVNLSAFTNTAAPTISGVVKLGEELTADAGGVTPAPDSLSYQWLADGRTIAGATTVTFTPGQQQVGRRISVRVTAHLAGYTDATVTSAATAPVAGSAAPSPRIDVAAAKQQLRRGQSTTLTWTSADADRVTASGAWTGRQPAAGRLTVKPGLGTSVYRLTATNQTGTATAQVAVTTTRQATRLRVAASARPVVRGTRTRLSVHGLDARESYTVRIAGRTVARGTADARGRVRRAVVVPRTRPTARQLVTVTGSRANRAGRDTLAVVTGKLTATATKSQARASTSQRVTVRGLVPGQKVRVAYRGQRVSAATARATRAGTFTVRFDVGQRWGTKTVTVRSGGRSTQASFAVTPRHG